MTVNTISARPPRAGAYAPALTFYAENGSIDIDACVKHALWLAHGGLAGLVLMGSNGEAPLVEPEERKSIVKAIRKALDEADPKFREMDLIVGCGAQSLQLTMSQIADAASAGGNFALILPPSYWPGAMAKTVLREYYRQICAQSPLPILLYNFPLVAAGVGFTSDDILAMAEDSPNFVGVKLSCGNLGTTQRVASALDAARFAVLAGRSEVALHSLVAGASGMICAVANVAPKCHSYLFELWTSGKIQEAQRIQALLADADWQCQKLGIAGIKAYACAVRGLPAEQARVRSPLLPAKLDPSLFDSKSVLHKLSQLEQSLR